MMPIWFRPWMAWAAGVVALGVMLGMQTLRLADEKAAHAKTRQENAEQIAVLERAARDAEAAARKEETRRTTEVQEAANEAQQQIDRARADAATASDAGQRLRERLAQLTAACHPPTSRAAPASPGPAAEPTADLLADVQRRLDAAQDRIAEFADRAHAAGAGCERSYDAMTAR